MFLQVRSKSCRSWSRCFRKLQYLVSSQISAGKKYFGQSNSFIILNIFWKSSLWYTYGFIFTSKFFDSTLPSSHLSNTSKAKSWYNVDSVLYFLDNIRESWSLRIISLALGRINLYNSFVLKQSSLPTHQSNTKFQVSTLHKCLIGYFHPSNGKLLCQDKTSPHHQKYITSVSNTNFLLLRKKSIFWVSTSKNFVLVFNQCSSHSGSGVCIQKEWIL